MRVFALFVLLALPVLARPADAPPAAITVTMRDTKDQAVGEVKLRDTPGGVLMTVTLRDVAPGRHGFHVHETGKCEAATGFKTAGGHWNPKTRKHGYESPDGYHAGDLPNVVAGEDRQVTAEMLLPGATVRPGEASSLLDADGSSIVLHAGPDDYHTDPAGSSGDRIACGVVEKAR